MSNFPWLTVLWAVVYLASEEARYVTGMQMRVDAGSYLKFQDYHV